MPEEEKCISVLEAFVLAFLMALIVHIIYIFPSVFPYEQYIRNRDNGIVIDILDEFREKTRIEIQQGKMEKYETRKIKLVCEFQLLSDLLPHLEFCKAIPQKIRQKDIIPFPQRRGTFDFMPTNNSFEPDLISPKLKTPST